MSSLFCNLCFSQPSGLVEYSFTKCLHIFCPTCLNTSENKGNSSKFLKQICLFCDLPNASYRKINKSQNFGEAISKINTLRILSQLQEKQLKSMVKLSNKYDDALPELRKKYLKTVEDIQLFKKICFIKVYSVRQVKKKIKKYKHEIDKFNNFLEKNVSRRRRSISSSGLRLSTSCVAEFSQNGSQLLQQISSEFNTTNTSYLFSTDQEKNDSLNISRQGCTLSKSLFDQTF
ncbi:Zinc finger, RING-type domain and Zinc finger, RING/FYVE/PHD-type domain-containing protein [Strongyloides ratti]|uniref:Zinc finger, RING-type domain and Zinc finger, RING/FYVE/PHD-type domain-containing protein n=1 Tax=Strongyloides ratti TaxID=34506 RepID=A0A090LC91_STRRB|nr:Zinc finger, RING-type domain and Zinc finger, RING/FYVE/PHD-type domain-containing protein [Strongyloides ratti]CEF67392.1 Zinc finger, RING-type domain and Zinc finger, RING/FYVE/PHD-type domain-containing protein [Strongyloides ratti]